LAEISGFKPAERVRTATKRHTPVCRFLLVFSLATDWFSSYGGELERRQLVHIPKISQIIYP
jgi:hypothetical protein